MSYLPETAEIAKRGTAVMPEDESEEKILVIAEEDQDLSQSLDLFFTGKFKVKLINKRLDILAGLSGAVCLLIDSGIIHEEGINFLKEIRESFPDLFIVIMDTAIPAASLKHASLEKYSNTSVFKPFDADYIYQVLSRRLNNNKT